MLKQQSTEIKMRFHKFEFKLKQIFREAWPIKWPYLKQPKTIFRAIVQSAYSVQAIIVSLLLAVIVSLNFLLYSLYLASTVEVASQGGEIREAVVGGEMNIFNPVFDPRSNAESKIVSLLYFPLYEIEYPDFLSPKSSFPTIKPILLSKPPEWIDLNDDNIANRFKIIRFTLKDGVKWSDGSNITIADIEYTINRLKEDRGNSLFRDVLADLTFEKLSEKEFLLRSPTSNPQLIYLLNFRPIPESFFDFEDTDGLFTDPRSRRPTVTSGYFRFPAGTVQNPNSSKNEMVDNPVRDTSGKNIAVVLEKNPIQNTKNNLLVDKYILSRYDSLLAVSGESQMSLEQATKAKTVDLYTRFLGSGIDTDLDSQKIREKLGLTQKIIPTNTYYSAYFNIAQGIRQNYTGYLINQTLRKYIACHLLDYIPNSAYSPFIESIPREQRLIPLHLKQSYNLDCGDKNGILDPKYYSIEQDSRTGVKRVILNGDIIQLRMVGLSDSQKLLTDLQLYFRDQIGIPVELDLITDTNQVTNKIDSGDYNLAVLPIKMVVADPKPLYGASGRNLSKINLNNRVESYAVNDYLDKYSNSDLNDNEAKEKLFDFFSKEFVSVNLYRANQEFNISNRTMGVNKNLPNISTFPDDIYFKVDSWYLNTSRSWFWAVDDKLRVTNF